MSKDGDHYSEEQNGNDGVLHAQEKATSKNQEEELGASRLYSDSSQ